MPGRPLPALLALLLLSGGHPPDAASRRFAAHCESAQLPNFTIPFKSIASRDSLAYAETPPDLATLTGVNVRIVTHFGAPATGDVEVAQYGASPGRYGGDDAYGRIVALFRFCDARAASPTG